MENPPNFDGIYQDFDGDFHGLLLLVSGRVYNMDVSKNSGTPKWMVYFMENPIKNG